MAEQALFRSPVKRINVRWLCLRPPEQLDTDERQVLEQVLAEDERLARGHSLLQQFRRLIARRSIRDLDAWLGDAASSGQASFASFARGIETDRTAVNNGLTLPWLTGSVEGH